MIINKVLFLLLCLAVLRW